MAEAGKPGRLGDYDLEGELGRGGFGRVFRARERSTGVLRAVKVLEGPPDPETLERFRREAQALSQLGGRGVVPVHQSGIERGRLWFAMDFMPGGSLRDRVKAGRLPWREAAGLVAKVARTLERGATLGLVHRDVKPENVLIDEQGEPRLADFGCVLDLGASRLTESGAVLGTPAYLAPELLEGAPADARTDVFSLGAVLYELLAGRPPHEGSSPYAIALAAREGKRKPLGAAGAPPELEAVVERALAPRAARTESAARLAEALEAVLAGEQAPLRASRAPLLLAPLALGALAVAAWALRGPASPASPPPPALDATATPTSRGAPPPPPPPPPPRAPLAPRIRSDVAAVASQALQEAVLLHRERPAEDMTEVLRAAKDSLDGWAKRVVHNGTARDAESILDVFAKAREIDPTFVAPDSLREAMADVSIIVNHDLKNCRSLLLANELWGPAAFPDFVRAAGVSISGSSLSLREKRALMARLEAATGPSLNMDFYVALVEIQPEDTTPALVEDALVRFQRVLDAPALPHRDDGYWAAHWTAIEVAKTDLRRAVTLLESRLRDRPPGASSAYFLIAKLRLRAGGDLATVTRDIDEGVGRLRPMLQTNPGGREEIEFHLFRLEEAQRRSGSREELLAFLERW